MAVIVTPGGARSQVLVALERKMKEAKGRLAQYVVFNPLLSAVTAAIGGADILAQP
jgi:hypothetical protein